MSGRTLYKGTISSTGIETTSTPNEVLDFKADGEEVRSFAIVNEGPAVMNIKVNGESNSHYLKPGESWATDQMRVDQILIAESGSNYRYSGLTANPE